jgi:non-classical export protein 1
VLPIILKCPGRGLDPLLGVFTGVLAYYLAETNPRTAPPPEDTLRELLRWKRDKWRRQQSEIDADATDTKGVTASGQVN